MRLNSAEHNKHMKTRKEKVDSGYSEEVSKGLLGYFQQAYSFDQTIEGARQARDRALTEGFTYAYKHKIDRYFCAETLVKAGYTDDTAKKYVHKFFKELTDEAKKRMAKGETTFHEERKQQETQVKSKRGNILRQYFRAVRQCNMLGKAMKKTKPQHLAFVEQDWDAMVRPY